MNRKLGEKGKKGTHWGTKVLLRPEIEGMSNSNFDVQQQRFKDGEIAFDFPDSK